MSNSRSEIENYDAPVLENGKKHRQAQKYTAPTAFTATGSAPAETSGQFYLRVRCDAGKWKKLGGENNTSTLQLPGAA